MTEAAPFPIESIRRAFPALSVGAAGAAPPLFFDGPGGSQVPLSVADAVRDYLLNANANCGGAFATSVATDAMLARARGAAAEWFGADDADEVVFGANMTSLTYAIAAASATRWKAGDVIVVTDADHDANITPWRQAAAHVGAEVAAVPLVRAADGSADGSLDLSVLDAALATGRVRLVAVGAASNLLGTVHPVADICGRVRAAGAWSYVDAVHYAPHRLLDVAAWGCDFAVCSTYKFLGPHVGMLWGRRDLLEQLPAAKVRPASDQVPDRWLRGTQCHEGIAGALAAFDYWRWLGTSVATRAPQGLRQGLTAAFDAVQRYEEDLGQRLLQGALALDGVTAYGVLSPERAGARTPTVALRKRGWRCAALAAALAERGCYVWPGHSYAVELTRQLGLAPDGVVRVGLLHYNTAAEVDAFLAMLAEL